MGLNETKEFTQPAVLFALTGHVFLREDMQPEYRDRCLSEIKEDSVYKYIMKEVPTNLLNSTLAGYDGEIRDVDPILTEYICSKNIVLAGLKDFIDGSTLDKATKKVQQNYLNHGYVEVSPIDFLSFVSIAEEVNRKFEETIK